MHVLVPGKRALHKELRFAVRIHRVLGVVSRIGIRFGIPYVAHVTRKRSWGLLPRACFQQFKRVRDIVVQYLKGSRIDSARAAFAAKCIHCFDFRSAPVAIATKRRSPTSPSTSGPISPPIGGRCSDYQARLVVAGARKRLCRVATNVTCPTRYEYRFHRLSCRTKLADVQAATFKSAEP